MATRTGVCANLPVCVPVRCGLPFSANKETLTVPLVLGHPCSTDALGATTSGPSRAPTGLPKLCCARVSPCLSPRTPLGQRRMARKEGATLQQTVSLKDPRTPTPWILACGKNKKGTARKTRNQVALLSETSTGST